ncbi:Hydantoin utilization protein A (fragment) [uncultured Desulfobacterium sp.]|uniref:Hydantoin utilization protein A n=1 Tax=uncultured Desulfobacterium sp. TaxID=201089 RepID=A0A445MV86_9BACT
MIIGVDTGGTFTDFVYKKDGYWEIYKSPSTPVNPAIAVLKGLTRISFNSSTVNRQIVHGSTVATNAILERKGAKTAIITNKGFEDVIEIGRQNRARLYDLSFRRPGHIVPPEMRFGVRGRILSTGEEKEALDIASLKDIAGVLKGQDVESVAVCLLFSFVNPSHEQKTGAILQDAGIPFFLSHEIVAEFREFERTSTTVINAYVSPKMQGYIGSLISGLNQSDALSIMQSNGGRITAETAMRESVRTIISGPAGGAVGAFEVGKAAGYDKLISFDMGGTSSDVCLIDGALPLTTESGMAGYPVKVPMIDIHTVGAGGGSIAYLDQGGSLRVGPRSAGADPGPICYGRGEMITVTDANLFLGRLIPDGFLGGQMILDKKRLHFYLPHRTFVWVPPICCGRIIVFLTGMS